MEGILVRKAIRVRKVRQGLRVRRAFKAYRVRRAKRELKAHRDHKAPRARKAQRVIRATKGTKAIPALLMFGRSKWMAQRHARLMRPWCRCSVLAVAQLMGINAALRRQSDYV